MTLLALSLAAAFSLALEDKTSCLAAPSLVAAVSARIADDSVLTATPDASRSIVLVEVDEHTGFFASRITIDSDQRVIGPIGSCAELEQATVVAIAIVLDGYVIAPPIPVVAVPVSLPPAVPTWEGQAMVGLGIARALQAGLSVSVGVGQVWWQGPVDIVTKVDISVDVAMMNQAPGAIVMVVPLLSPKLCVRTLSKSLDVCAAIDAGAAIASGVGVREAATAVAPQLSPGLHVAALLPWTVLGMGTTLSADVRVPLVRATITDSDRGTVLFAAPAVAGVVSIGLRAPWW